MHFAWFCLFLLFLFLFLLLCIFFSITIYNVLSTFGFDRLFSSPLIHSILRHNSFALDSLSLPCARHHKLKWKMQNYYVLQNCRHIKTNFYAIASEKRNIIKKFVCLFLHSRTCRKNAISFAVWALLKI